jgi:RHS repeat-associated protein
LTGTAVLSDNTGAQVASINYYPYGSTRSSSGTLPAQKFTGQRLDDSGLYYYSARYYDAEIGRFISADTIGWDTIRGMIHVSID